MRFSTATLFPTDGPQPLAPVMKVSLGFAFEHWLESAQALAAAAGRDQVCARCGLPGMAIADAARGLDTILRDPVCCLSGFEAPE